MPANNTVHYNASLSLTKFKSQGQGECGASGYITGYHGVVTCKACKQIVQQEKALSFTAVKNSFNK